MGHEILKKFDRYILLDCVAQGGMAEIFRARLASREGTNRLVVIKRILAQFGGNKDFQNMFRSETKVMLGFNHPNVVQLYDFGEVSGQPYIAMEYVDGKNLRQFISRLSKLDEKFPIELAVYIIEQAAAGLHYAHQYRDKVSGEHLHVVHRDVSPQNILISFDGNVKVIDFGIAKAASNAESTRVGIIKGKPSYLSPEQITGEKLDGRSDVFSLGAVLWEALTGSKLFRANPGENEFAVLKLIESPETVVKPPSSLNPAVPKELDEIVLRALSKNREKRYQSAEEIHKALRRFLYAQYPDFTPADLADYAKNFFKNEIVEDRKLLQKLYSKVDTLVAALEIDQLQDDGPTRIRDRGVGPSQASAEFRDTENTGTRTPFQLRDTKAAEVEVTKTRNPTLHQESQTKMFDVVKREIPAQRLRKEKQSALKSAMGLVALGGFIFVAFVVIYHDRLGWKLPYFGPTTPDSQAVHELPHNKEQRQTASEAEQKQTPPTETAPAARRNINLVVDLMDGGATLENTKIFVNDVAVDVLNPIVSVPMDTAIRIRVLRTNYKPYVDEVVLSSERLGNELLARHAVTLEELKFGYVTLMSTPSSKAILQPIDDLDRPAGEKIEFQTPVFSKKLPVGRYVLNLRNELLGMEKTRLIEVMENKTIKVEEALEIRN